jgi:CRISPR/Cas system-associated exonuclease Cas4 (RecB family)
VENSVDWYVEARLYLRSGVRGKVGKELFRGQFGEAIHMALARSVDERSRLIIACAAHDPKLTWAKIEKLAVRADFPVIV